MLSSWVEYKYINEIIIIDNGDEMKIIKTSEKPRIIEKNNNFCSIILIK